MPWEIEGNNNINSTHFLGTRNNQPLVIRTNADAPGNQARMLISADGNVSIRGLTRIFDRVAIGQPAGLDGDFPAETLHVDGRVLSTGTGAAFKFRNRGSANPADDWVWYSQDNVARFWRNGVGDLIFVTTNGSVGIGLAVAIAPRAKLHVDSSSDLGVFGTSDTGPGVGGSSDSGDGVGGRSERGPGVLGESERGRAGVVGIGTPPIGTAPGAAAGYFDGNLVVVNGNKPFKIDHPLDPQNKYLLHNSVESFGEEERLRRRCAPR